MITNLYKERLKKDIFRLSILTLITVIIWIGLAIQRTLSKNQLNPVLKRQIIPLTPSLDLDTIEKTEKRQQIPTVDWDSLKPIKTKILIEPEATQAGKLND